MKHEAFASWRHWALIQAFGRLGVVLLPKRR